MDRISIWVLPILIFLITPLAIAEETEVRHALVQFMEKLAPGNPRRDSNFGWNISSDPCNNRWVGVTCCEKPAIVCQIILDGSNLTGIFSASSICMVRSLLYLSLKNNTIGGSIPEEIGKCKNLTHLYLSGNKFSGRLPDSLSGLGNLKKLDISDNNLSGELPELPRISGLKTFLAQNNHLSGGIPNFDFSNFEEFNVSNNNFNGPIPDVQGLLTVDSFSGNPELCGKPLSTACPTGRLKSSSPKEFLIYSGYIVLGVIMVVFLALKLIRKKVPKEEKVPKKEAAVDITHIMSSDKPSETSNEFKFGINRPEFSMTSIESSVAISKLVVLTSSTVRALRFEDLLRAPAELLGKGKHGSLYKVMLSSGEILAVKRIKDWEISEEDFRRRMRKLDLARHSHVLPPAAFYCSEQEKLLVYEYQQNGSLFQLLQYGSKEAHTFDWGSRLGVAANIAEALAFMHKELHEDGIAHGNLKSTNILFDRNMHTRISEYGLMAVENQDETFPSQGKGVKNKNPRGGHSYSSFKLDVYAFGVILLELLTGKLVQNSGFDLSTWVHSVVKEEWTVEVFDEALLSEDASEERMVNLLQIALKCINPSPNARPSMGQLAARIMKLKQEEESSISFDAGGGMHMGGTSQM